ncbi:MAG TPA: pyridoxamine 5'-phosphate oxidase family protein [Candidatus Micrarchaeia archaeon]|nr:pyridoxamine 5'-phosphate oxidase family protein [Candidatus Micrarchaeia archaeon]
MPGSGGRAGGAAPAPAAGRLTAAVGRDRLRALDRFLQWDLVTVTPWGAPVVSPVGARLDPATATLWTSTATGVGRKLRNLTAHPRAAALFARPGEPTLLLRGAAHLHAGDGTQLLAQLFRLMGGAGGARAFYATTAADPAWRWLYRAYWRRCLIELRVCEAWTQSGGTVLVHPVRRWPRPGGAGSRPAPPPAPPGRARPIAVRGGGDLERRGRALLAAGYPTVVAHSRAPGEAPVAWPARAQATTGGFTVGPLPSAVDPGRAGSIRAGLAVHIVDDAFETAEAVGWIGTLGRDPSAPADPSRRRFRPRRTYGFVKPPGRAIDAAAGLLTWIGAALAGPAEVPGPGPVSAPDVALAARAAGGRAPTPPDWPEAVWPRIEGLFLDSAGDVLALGACAALAPAEVRAGVLGALDRAQRRRDAAHGLLLRGERSVPAGGGLGRLVAARPPAVVMAALGRRTTGRVRRRAFARWVAELDTRADAAVAAIGVELGCRLPGGHALGPARGPCARAVPGAGADAAGPDAFEAVTAGGRAAAATALAVLDRVRRW